MFHAKLFYFPFSISDALNIPVKSWLKILKPKIIVWSSYHGHAIE